MGNNRMRNLNPNTSIITLSANGLKIITWQKLSNWGKNNT